MVIHQKRTWTVCMLFLDVGKASNLMPFLLNLIWIFHFFFFLKYVKPFIFFKLYKGNQIKLLAFKVFSSQLLISLQLYIGSQNFTFVAHMVSMGLWQVLGSNLTRIKKQRFSHLFNIVSIAVPTISVKLPRIGRAPMLCSIWPICQYCFLPVTRQHKVIWPIWFDFCFA